MVVVAFINYNYFFQTFTGEKIHCYVISQHSILSRAGRGPFGKRLSTRNNP